MLSPAFIAGLLGIVEIPGTEIGQLGPWAGGSKRNDYFATSMELFQYLNKGYVPDGYQLCNKNSGFTASKYLVFYFQLYC